jgi:hypothetical protein
MDKRIVILLCVMTVFGVNATAGGRAASPREESPLVNRGDYALRGTVLVQYLENTEDLIIPADLDLTEIGEGAFRWHSSLATITLPASLTSIGNDAFYRCGSLSTIDLPTGLTSIGKRAFYWCGSLATANLPTGLTSIGEQAFAYCRSLSRIDLPAGLTSMGDEVFSMCTSLTRVRLPSSLTSIGNDVFYGCGNLSSIILQSSQPPRLIGSLGISDSTLIYVPAASLDTYKNAEGWNEHAARIQAAEN